MDVEKFRKDNISEKIIEYIAKNRKYINWWDQDGFNAILFDKWKEIDPRWNQPYHIYDFASWKESPFDEETYNKLINQPHIIHYNTYMKPWLYYCNHPRKDIFFHYLDMTKWAGWRPKEENKIWAYFKAKLRRLFFSKRA
jgi:lipopolysaccharide biosynthesis glycosyltransferase